DASEIARRKDLAGEAMRHHLDGGRLGPGGLEDPVPILERLAPEAAVLDGAEVSRLIAVLRAGASLRRDLSGERGRYPALAEVGASMPDLAPVTRLIEGRVAADGRLEDNASPELAAARRRIAELESALQRQLMETLERAAEQGILQDRYVTVRNARFVIP